ncbi:MAG TPA: sensor histidine kinase [Sphingobacterium sp.]|nr:sensor histidine kinase [Sphingobacterium sp.]
MQKYLWKRQVIFTVLLHVLAWVGFLSLPILFIRNRNVELQEVFVSWEFWFFGLCFIVPYYLNSSLWTPYIIRKRQYVLYLISIASVGVIFALWLRPFDRLMQLNSLPKDELSERRPTPPPVFQDERFFPSRPRDNMRPPPPNRKGHVDIASVYIVLFVIILGSLFRVVQYWIQSQQKIQQVQYEWTKAELAFLKAQAHPHFLFNTLNNIYSLALTGDPATAASIHKLSQLMRYYMDEREEEKVDLQDEIRAIQDFISLQKLRIGTNCTLTERYEGLHISKQIFPFILLPFVENAFKYGLQTSGACYLDLRIVVTDEGCLIEVKNSISKELSNYPSAGTGLKNTRKLLKHLYPDRFSLNITTGEHDFFVKLTLKI